MCSKIFISSSLYNNCYTVHPYNFLDCSVFTAYWLTLHCYVSICAYSPDAANYNLWVGDCGQGHGRKWGGPNRNSHSYHYHHRQEWPCPRVHTSAGEKHPFISFHFFSMMHFFIFFLVTSCSVYRHYVGKLCLFTPPGGSGVRVSQTEKSGCFRSISRTRHTWTQQIIPNSRLKPKSSG